MHPHLVSLTRVSDPRLGRNECSLGFATAFAVIALCLGFWPSSADAAKLTKVKGDQVLVDLEGEGAQYSEGSRYLVMVDGKRKAVVELSKVKGEKALGKVLKGTAYEGGTLAPLQASGGSTQASNESPSKNSGRRKKRSRRGSSSMDGFSYGGVGGYSITNQTVSRSGESIAMTGSSLSLKAFGDYPISGNIGAMGRVGFENFSVAGKSTVTGDAKTTILYLDADLLFRYYLTEGNFKVFPVGGLGLHYPISKTSNVLDVSRLTLTTIFFLGAGFNFMMNDTMYIHSTVEYGLFPPSSDVTTNLIAIRAGVGWML